MRSLKNGITALLIRSQPGPNQRLQQSNAARLTLWPGKALLAAQKTDTVHFGKHTKAEDLAILEENDRLAEGLIHQAKACETGTLVSRATYNITKDRDVLNCFLPYRDEYTKKHDKDSLKQYDALVVKIMEKSEFYTTKKASHFRKKILAIYPKNFPYVPVITDTYRAIKRYFLNQILLFSRKYRIFFAKKLSERQKLRGKKITNHKVQSVLKQTVTPLNDDSTKYLIAAGIAELLHKHPEYATHLLDQKVNKHPLRFVLSNDSIGPYMGQDIMGLNLLWICKPYLWQATKEGKHNVSQHEFIHMFSEGSDMDVLPIMREAQKAEFRKLRTEIENHFVREDHPLSPLLDPVHVGSTGLRNYAFKDHLEFLAVSIDTFKTDPHKLCQTPSGKKLYNLFKDLFDIDPLNELPEKKPSPLPVAPKAPTFLESTN